MKPNRSSNSDTGPNSYFYSSSWIKPDISKLEPTIKPRHCDRGFSLVEILVILSVVGILAAIALPALAEILDNTASSKNKRNAQSIATLHAGARASGATFASSTKSGIVSELLQGKPGLGGLSGTIFRIPLTQAEAGRALAWLTYDPSSKELRFDKDAEESDNPGEAGLIPPPTVAARNPAYDEWFFHMFSAYANPVGGEKPGTLGEFKAAYSASHPPPPEFL